ncbi:hypothetical protein TanjilG_30240 [Lupinus angustifolius]|uniref:Uncharacterized protein n=1 Tax=Lupinus angustifolius TaxID=3871 RepID=A0A4P1R777_LUPAN|nr:PREDICTED: uncharacterized protein LOC109358465 [Lupinus angustifolius]OIW03964.1 hypothetical protein TanjilG_30240 [Lupinus angustifolius]
MGQGNYAKGLFYCGFLKTPFSFHATTNTSVSVTKESETKSNEVSDLELGAEKNDMLVKSFGEESVESELMRLHNLAGPPRYLFTIKEETKEDLEGEDEEKSRTKKGSRRRRRRSLSDLMLLIDTPLSTSPLKSFLHPLDSYKQQGFDPLFESSSAKSELSNMFSPSSPPSKFKFLKDAEDKLYTRLVEEIRKKTLKNHGVEDSPNAKTTNKKDKEFQQNLLQFPSSSLSQVHPLESSSTSFIPLEKESMVH